MKYVGDKMNQNSQEIITKWEQSGLLEDAVNKDQMAVLLERVAVQCMFYSVSKIVKLDQLQNVASFAFPIVSRVFRNKNFQVVEGKREEFTPETYYVSTYDVNSDNDVDRVTDVAQVLTEKLTKYNNLEVLAFNVYPEDKGFNIELMVRG